jgi:hypothetical protein
MKTTRLSLLMAGFVSVTVGCQPEEPTPAAAALPESREAALDGQVGTWSPRATMSMARAGHTATLLNSTGNVLVASYGTATVYNPYDDVWRPTPWMVVDRINHTATWIQDTSQVLVTGGRGNADVPFTSAELYDSVANTWRATASMSTGRYRHTATMLDSGQVLVTGGTSRPSETSSAELFDPATGTWSATGSMSLPRARHAATRLYSGKVLVTGGVDSASGTQHASAELYDPATGTWSSAGSMSRPRQDHVSIRLFSGSVMILGGAQDVGDLSVEFYDPYNDVWSMGLVGPVGVTNNRALTATILYTGDILVVDGMTGATSLYDPAANAWSSAGQGRSRRGHTANLLHTGEVLVVGGFDERAGDPLRYTTWYTR